MKDQDIFAHVNLVKGERSFLAELSMKFWEGSRTRGLMRDRHAGDALPIRAELV